MLSKTSNKILLSVLIFILVFSISVPVCFAEPEAQLDISLFMDLEYEIPVEAANSTIPMPYRLYIPEDYSSEKYPIVLFLHGSGERGKDNRQQFANGTEFIIKLLNLQKDNDYKCIILAPQCPSDLWWSNDSKYFDFDVKVLDALVDLINKVADEYNADLSRIYSTGLSMGGFGTWELMETYPDLFAAGVPICGGGDTKNAKKIKDIPIWAFHGDADDIVNVSFSRETVKALEKAKGNIKYTEYAGVDHSSWDNAYAEEELIPWIFSQQKQPKESGFDWTYIIISGAAAVLIAGGAIIVINILKKKRLKVSQ